MPNYCKWLQRCAQALEKMHELGYVHGDVRLRNMVFNSMGPK